MLCRNSFNPLCGDFHWDPAVSDTPGTLGLEMTPEHPKVGEEVTFVFTAADPDSPLSAACGIPGYDFGDGTNNFAEQQECARTSWPHCQPAYGPWDPPEPRPGHLEAELKHTFTQAGFYNVLIGVPPRVFTAEAATAAGNSDGDCMTPYHAISWGNAIRGVTVSD
jgi:hypothetical protein